jgi:hypothetical protein
MLKCNKLYVCYGEKYNINKYFIKTCVCDEKTKCKYRGKLLEGLRQKAW